MDIEEKKLYIKLAYGYYQNKEFKKALDLYEKIYKSDSEDFNILNMLADVYLKLNIREKSLEAYVSSLSILERKEQFEKVIKLSKKVIKNFPEDQRVKNKLKNGIRIMLNAAEKKVSGHEYADAKAIYENLQEFNSDEYPIDAKLKEISDEEAAFSARSRKQEDTKKDTPQDSHRDLLSKFDKMAQNYMNNGDYDGAVETYITALKLSPGNEELRTKLHKVYMTIAQGVSGEKVWDKLDKNPRDKLAEAKQKAMEERHAQIMKEEEARAIKMMDEDAKIQNDYEAQELLIIQAAAEELKAKLEEAHKNEKFKEEEVLRITREQEEKKHELLEKLKREAIDKFRKQKDAIQAQINAVKTETAPETVKDTIFEAKSSTSASLMENLKKAYETPKVGQTEPDIATVSASIKEMGKNIKVAKEIPSITQSSEVMEKFKDDISDDIGEVEYVSKNLGDEIIVNDDTLDSLITMAFIYINQGVIKEAMRIYNKLSEKYPDNREIKGLLEEITKRQG